MPLEPYYQDGTVTIYHGDCRELVPTLGAVALVVTDPPYGIGIHTQTNNLDSPWRDDEGAPRLSHILVGQEHCIWGGNYFADQLPPSEGWLVWIKRPAGWDFDCDSRSYAVLEMAWTDYPMKPRMKHHVWDGGLRSGDASNREFCHPTQKPLELMRWSIALSTTTGLVLDPYMGSGTTLRAAKDLGRPAVGIEREERFCEVAANRMAQESLFSEVA